MERKKGKPRIKPQKNSSNKAAWTAVIAALAAAVIAVVSVPTYLLQSAPDNAAQASGNRQLPIYSVATEEKKIAISFDCAWGVDYTDKLLELMAQNDVRCTFFAVQFWVEKYPEYAAKIVDAGHELGTHSRTHSYMSKLFRGWRGWRGRWCRGSLGRLFGGIARFLLRRSGGFGCLRCLGRRRWLLLRGRGCAGCFCSCIRLLNLGGMGGFVFWH